MNENVIITARQKFGLFFKELRKDNNQTQQQLAEFCGVSIQTINKVEQGKFPYSVDLLMKLSVVLGFTINFEPKENGNKKRFLLQKSEIKGNYIVTDVENEIVCHFEAGNFEKSQKFTFLKDKQHSNLATIMREFGEFLSENHIDLI